MTVTRWWLEGEVKPRAHATGLFDDVAIDELTLVTEHGGDDDPPCPVDEPERPTFSRYETTGDHAGWLDSTGIGVSLDFNDGAHGWIDHWAIARTNAPRALKPKRKR